MNDIAGKNNEVVTGEAQKVTLFIDANIFNLLCRPRSRGGFWTDLLTQISALPSVNAIVIPTLIADWEMRGGFSMFDDGKLTFFRADHTYGRDHKDGEKGRTSGVFSKFLSSASQYRLTDADQSRFVVIRGSNPKIRVIDSINQQRTLSEIAGIHFDTTLEAGKRQGKLMAFQKTDAGEEAMLYLARFMPGSGPSYLISEDQIFFGRMDRKATTKEGFAIGTAKFSTFITAAIEAMGLRISLKDVLYDLHRNGMEKKNIYLLDRCEDAFLVNPGRDRAGQNGETLLNLLCGARKEPAPALPRRISGGR